MLYRQWQSVAREFAGKTAVVHDGRAVTFAELAATVEAAPPVAGGPLVCHADGPGFFVDLLRAWRDGIAAVPVEASSPAPVLARCPPAGVALVKHTTGAAGVPRGIFFTPEALVAEAGRLVSAMGMDPASPNLAVVSLAHSYGFGNVVLPLLLHGVPVRWPAVPFPRVVEAAMADGAPLTIAAVPSIWRAWHRSGILANATIRLAVSAGSPLPADLELAIHRDHALKIHTLYGTSESGAISWDAGEALRESAAVVGQPLPGVDISILADGRVRVASDALGCGFDPPRPGDTLHLGHHDTRDLGRIDARGRLLLSGTLDGAVNVAGRKVSPEKIRRALLATGLLDGAKVFAVASGDPDRHQEISATIEWAAGTTPDLDALRNTLSRSLQGWEIPRKWKIRD